jgi:hypothetical protein
MLQLLSEPDLFALVEDSLPKAIESLPVRLHESNSLERFLHHQRRFLVIIGKTCMAEPEISLFPVGHG